MNGRFVSAVTCLLVVASLAGCIGSGSQQSGLPVATFDEAMSADGEVAEPIDSDSSVRLKLLDPADTSSVPTEKIDVVVVLYDGDSPITDAEMTLDAWMPSMGHGTSPEEDPAHRKEGIYAGSTNLIMAGDWVLKFNATLADGTSLAFEVPVTASGGSMDGDMDMGDGATFSSFQEAMDADGETYEPDEAAIKTTESASGSFDAAVPVEEAQSESMPFDVPEADGTEATISAEITSSGTGSDEITVSVRDPDGQEQASFTLTAGEKPSDNVTISPGTPGEWSVNVTGQGADIEFSIEAVVAVPVGEDLRLKTLDPATPEDAEQGKQPFVFLLYDSEAGEPVTNVSMTLASWMPAMGHGTDGEEDPTHQGDGVYKGQTNLVMGGEWQVNVTAELDNGGVVSWSIPATAE